MRKFSEIDKVNEEFINILNRGKNKKEPSDFTKTSKNLMELYCKNLLSEEFLTLHSKEKDKFDFYFYKIKSISKLGDKKFNVTMVTYDITHKALNELSYNLEI